MIAHLLRFDLNSNYVIMNIANRRDYTETSGLSKPWQCGMSKFCQYET